VRVAVEPGQHEPVRAHEAVVGEHRGDRHRQPERSHDQRLADRTGDLVERALTREADGDQRVVDAPDRAEQADEGRRRSDRRQHRQPRLEPRRILVDHAAHGARQELRVALAARAQRVPGEMSERLVGVAPLELGFDCGDRG
jgi:hypothetical protein